MIEKYYHHDGEQLTLFLQKSTYQNTQAECFCNCNKLQFVWQRSYSKQRQMPQSTHEGSWLRWIVIEQANYK